MIVYVANAILAIIGLYICRRIIKEKNRPGKMVCYLNGDCEKVLSSNFSKFFGIGIEYFGFAYYAAILVGYLGILFYPPLGTDLLVLLLTLATTVGFILSLHLIMAQLIAIKSWCTWCLGSSAATGLIFIISIFHFIDKGIVISEVLASGISALMLTQLIAISVGAAAALVVTYLTIKFLKDFKIDERENKHLRYINQIIWTAIVLVLISNLGLYLISPEAYAASGNLLVQSVILAVIILNNLLLTGRIKPKLIGIRLNLSSINVFKTFWLRQNCIASLAVSIVSWLSIIFFTFFITPFTGDITLLVSQYISIIVIGVILSQVAIFTADRIKLAHR